MRDLIRSAGPNGRVSAILQVSDVNSREVRSLLSRDTAFRLVTDGEARSDEG
jgi:hypothetical protein